MVRPKPRPWRRAGRRLSQKPGLKLAIKGASKSAVADFDQPNAAGCVRRARLRAPCGLSANAKLKLTVICPSSARPAACALAGAPIPLRPRSDFGRHVPGTTCPGFTWVRCCSSPSHGLAAPSGPSRDSSCLRFGLLSTLYEDFHFLSRAMPDLRRMTEGHHLRRREASLTRARCHPCARRDLRCFLVQRIVARNAAGAMSSHGDEAPAGRRAPIRHGTAYQASRQQSLKPFLVAIPVPLELSFRATPWPHSSTVPPHPKRTQHVPKLLHPASLQPRAHSFPLKGQKNQTNSCAA